MNKTSAAATIWPFQARMAMTLGVTLIYVLAFTPFYNLVLRSAIALSVVPIIVAANSFGLWGGIVAGLLSIPLNMALYAMVGDSDPSTFVPSVFLSSHLVFILIGLAVGYPKLVRSRLEAAEREQHALNEALRDTAGTLSSTLDLDEVLDRILGNVRRVVESDSANIMLIEDGVAQTVRTRSYTEHASGKTPIGQRLSVAETPTLRQMVRDRQPLTISDTRDHPGWADNPESRWIRSYASVPIQLQDEVIGFLNINSTTPRHYTPGHAERLQVFADQAAIAIHNARLYEQIQQHATELEWRVSERTSALQQEVAERAHAEKTLLESHDRLSVLRRVDGELTRKLSVEWVLTITMDAAMRLSGASAAYIALAEGEQIHIVLPSGRYTQEKIGAEVPSDVGIPARVMRTRQAELVTDVSEDPDYEANLPTTRSQMTIPLISQKNLIGLLNLETHRPEKFTAETFESLKLLGARIAVAADNALMYEERMQLISELDAFAHTVAHDLKNPLSIVTGYADMLAASPDIVPADDMQSYLQEIADSAVKMRSIIDALLLLSTVRKSGTVTFSDLDMGHIAAEAQHRLRNLIEEQEAEIVAADVWPVAQGYAAWVEEIWANYISNALKYGGRPPRVELGATVRENDMICFWTRDNGQGLTNEEQAGLFTPFTRLGQVEIEGHGLGLSIVQRIVDKLGGEVGVESAPGEGSTFWFTLPASGEVRTD
jgi:signal transduction histidine kinase/uncharacterized protein YigA (DUF484 family)